MPELPEVETTRRGIAPALVQHRVVDVIIRDRRLRWPIAADFESKVRDQIVRRVDRRAKYILLGFDTGTAILHLGMSGSLRILAAGVRPLLHDHWDLRMDSGSVLRFHDPRRFGSLHWTGDDPASHRLLARLAPEPLARDFDGEYLFKVSRPRKVAIKLFIMNSQVVVGVGNIYASEALFRAGLRPTRAAGRINRAQAEALVKAIKSVLEEAIAIGGTTLRDYVNADGIPGYFRQRLFVYERAGEACHVCKTQIRHINQGHRSTYYCRKCQT